MDRRYELSASDPADVQDASREWLVGGGEMGDLIRALDWSKTPLGPRASWREPLRAVVSLVVASPFAMALLWGRDLIFIYNDAYRIIAGGKHPAALGRSTREIWPEVWHINEPIFTAVMERGETVYLEDALFSIDRHGFDEDAYFTLGYSPVRVDGGAVGGALVTLQETTARVAERERLLSERQRALDTFEHGEACIVVDRDYRVVLVNREQERISGKPRGATLGRIIWDVWPDHADPASPFRRAYDHVMRERRPLTFEEFFEPLSAWLYVRVYPMASGGLAAFFHDTTARRLAEESLRASEARFRALALASSDVLYRMSPDWREMRNLSSGRFLAETVEPDVNWMEKYIHPDDRGRVLAAIHEATRRGDTFELEHRVVTRDGSVGWTYSRATPLKSAAGDVVEWFGVASDVTARKRTEEALRASEAEAQARAADLARAQAAAHLGSWRWDLVHDTVSWSDELYRIFGVDPATFVPSNAAARERIHPDDRERHARLAGAALAGTPVEAFESRIVRPSGEQRIVLASGFEVERDGAGRPTALFGTVLDITDRKRMEDALREADRRKDEFLGMLSHELRNPLAPIRNSLHILDRAAPTGEQARRAKEVANRQIVHLTRLVDDLLDVTRIARGKIELRRAPIDVAALAHRTAEDHQAIMHERRLELRVQLPPGPVVVNADATRLAQVLGNLLHNAAKFTPAGGQVTLAVAAEGDRAVIRVRDTGVGIAPEVLPTMFEPFTQGKQALARTEGGLGLGLALVKGFVELHGGDVRAHGAREGGGTEFVVTLPLGSQGQALVTGAPERAPRPRGRRRRVLVIDDNRDAADTIAELVEMLGNAVDVAYDASDGLAKAAEEIPDVVFCDIGLPGMDGYEFARQFRALAAKHRVRLVALSGYAQPDDVARALEAGFDAHVAKPPDPEALAGMLA